MLEKYSILEELGHGGMATVYRAHDPRLGRDVAIKLIHPHLRDSPEIAHRFFVEAKTVARLRHRNILDVYDISSPDEAEQYLVVELVRGSSLREVLRRVGRVPPELAAAIALELLAALDHAHEAGVVHRDIKPENVMVEIVGTRSLSSPMAPSSEPCDSRAGRVEMRVKLTDFGIAKLLDAQGVTSTGQVLGSPAHMAPEQIEGGEVDARSDVFSLGVLVYELMVGHLPFEGSNPAQVLRRVLDGLYTPAERECPDVGARWSKIIDRALAQSPDDRFQNAGEMAKAIREELELVDVEVDIGEFPAFLDDPEGYRDSLREMLVERLCVLGKLARARGQLVDAAADYNRALALAPQDQKLIRLVAAMNRDERRSRLLKRTLPLALAAMVCGSLAFALARHYRTARANDAHPTVATRPPDKPRVTPRPAATKRTALASVPASAPPTKRINPPTLAPHNGAGAAGAQREIVLASLSPPFGVRVALDDHPPIAAHTGMRLVTDRNEHQLVFSCANDACDPERRVVAAGSDAQELGVTLSIRAALLLVVGDPSASYHVREVPNASVRPGLPTKIPMRRGRWTVTVTELPSNRQRVATLVAGGQTTVSFNDAEL